MDVGPRDKGRIRICATDTHGVCTPDRGEFVYQDFNERLNLTLLFRLGPLVALTVSTRSCGGCRPKLT